MSERIRTLVKRISETRPIQTSRRQGLLNEMRALRRDLDAESAPDQAHCLDAAMLLMEFMARSEDVATSETLQIVASLVSGVDERLLRAQTGAKPQEKAQEKAQEEAPRDADVAAHPDLRLTQQYLLGSVLTQAGMISPDSLARALHLHASSGLPLGQCLIQLGASSPEQIEAAVAYQEHLREVERSARAAEAERAPRLELRLSDKQRGFVQSMNTQVLGEVLIRIGAITRPQLERALQLQRVANVHIGEALVQSGATGWEQVKRALELQRQMRRGVA